MGISTLFKKRLHFFSGLAFSLITLLTLVNTAKAEVSYNLWGVGGGISADNAVGGATESFFSLASLNIEQLNSTGFFPGASNYKFKIVAPQYWRFEAGVGNLIASSHFSASSITVTETEIEITYSTYTSVYGAKLDISGIRIQSTNPRNMEDGKILYQPVIGNISGLTPATELGTLKQKAGEVKKLMVFLPGEQYTQDPLVPSGKIGTPTAQIVGSPFNIEVRTVDEHFNTATTEEDEFYEVTPISHTISFSSTDPSITIDNVNLIDGVQVTSVVAMNAGSHTITATNVTKPIITSSVSTTFTVTKSPFSNLLLLLPGETLSASSPNGKTGTPTPQAAGDSFIATVYAVDQYWFADASVNGNVEITHTGVNGASPVILNLVNGAGTVNVNSSSTGNIVFTAAYPADPAITDGTSTATINPNTYTKILALFEGQYHVPGSATGVGGNPIIPDRSGSIKLTILAVDDNYNLIANIHNSLTFEPDEELVMYEEDSFEYLEDLNVNYTNGQHTLNVIVEEDPASLRTLIIRDADNSIFTTINIPLPSTPTSPSDYFRTVKSGNWSDMSVWENSSDGTTWNLATLLPTTAASGITIRTGHTINVNTNVGNIAGNDTSFEFIVQQNASLDISGVNQISFSKTGLYGTIVSNGEFASTETRVYSTGVFTLNSNNNLVIPVATWDAGSVCNIIGITSQTGAITGIGGRTLSTLNFNSPALTGSVHFSGGALNIRNLNVTNTGVGTLRLVSESSGSVESSVDTLNIINGRLSVNNSTASGAYHNLNIKNLNFQNGTITKEGTTAGTIIFNTTTPVFTIGAAATFNSAVNISFIPSSTIDFGTNEFKGSTGSFTIAGNSTVISAHPQGISTSGATGNVQFSGVRTFPNTTGMIYHFNGEALQNIGNLVPTTLFAFKLIIDNAVGVQMPEGGGNFYTNNVEILRGYLDLNGARRVHASAEPFSGSGELRIQHTQTSFPIPQNKTWSGTIHLNGIDQSIVAGNYNNLTVSGGSKTLTGAINIAGNFDASGASSVAVGTHKVTYNGTGNQNVAGIPYYDLDVNNSGTKTITAPATVSNNVNVSTGTLHANGNLTLLADGSKNANIAAITNGGAVTGNVKVPVIITGGVVSDRGARTLSSPINESASARNTLAQLKDFVPLMGMTGHVGMDDLEYMQFNASYISKYVETRNNSVTPYSYINNINESIQPGEGFQIFFTGNRNNISTKVKAPFANPETVTAVYEGVINQGAITRSVTNSAIAGDPYNGKNLIGNPYPATLDAQAFLLANQANLNEGSLSIFRAGRGTATYNASLNEETNNANRYLRPGQGFFVSASQNANLSFQESHKATAGNYGSTQLMNAKAEAYVKLDKGSNETVAENVKVVNSLATSPIRKLKMRLSEQESYDEAFIAFSKDFSNKYGFEDSKYFSVEKPKTILSSYTEDEVGTSFNLLSDVNETREINLWVEGSVSGPMSLEFVKIENLDEIDVYVKDKYKLTQTLLDKSNPVFNFDIDRSNAATFGTKRLSLVFVPNETLSVINKSFTVKKDLNKVVLNFSVTDNANVVKYVVERSHNSNQFVEIGTFTPNQKDYIYYDLNPLHGNNYYRIRSIYPNKTDYSEIRDVNFAVETNWISLYPNPADNYVNIKANAQLEGKIEYKVLGLNGKYMTSGSFNANSEETVKVEDLASGIYFIELRKANGELIERLKFVKK